VRKADDHLPLGIVSENVAQVLQCLNEDENFEVQSFCQVVSEPCPRNRHQAKLAQFAKTNTLVLNADIYGALDLFDVLGRFLAEVDLFLQRQNTATRMLSIGILIC
jgi:hypothetical protein